MGRLHVHYALLKPFDSLVEPRALRPLEGNWRVSINENARLQEEICVEREREQGEVLSRQQQISKFTITP